MLFYVTPTLDWMLPNCPVACNDCDVGCADLNEHCPAWKKSGECEENKVCILDQDFKHLEPLEAKGDRP